MKISQSVVLFIFFSATSLLFAGCKKEAPAPAINRVIPVKINADEISIMRLRGSGFQVHARVFFDDIRSPGVMVEDETRITMIVPRLNPGIVNIKLVNPDGKQVIIERAFRVSSLIADETILPFAESAGKMDVAGGIRDNDVGVAFGDYNNDGLEDILIACQMSLRLFMNNGEHGFINVTEIAGLTRKNITHGAAWADFDNDSYLDLVLAYELPVILKNTRKGTFEDMSADAGIPKQQGAYSPFCADYNRDGFVDIFITGFSKPDMLLRNEGNFKFTSVFSDLFKDDKYMTPSAAWGDYDNDGYPDLFVANVGGPSRLFHNERGKKFTEVAKKAGVDNQRARDKSGELKYGAAWGTMWADYDNDGWIDLFIANFTEANRIFHNRGDGTFENAAPGLGVRESDGAMGMSAADFNNDGYIDLFVNDIMSNFKLYINQAGAGFRKVTKDAGLDYKDYSSHGSAWSDINQDGAIDLYVINNIRPNFFFINQKYPDTHYLEVKLAGKKSNAAAIGARVVAQVEGMKMVRDVKGSHGYISQDSFVLHFGLGRATKVDSLTILWPSGIEQKMKDVDADQRLVITEPVEE